MRLIAKRATNTSARFAADERRPIQGIGPVLRCMVTRLPLTTRVPPRGNWVPTHASEAVLPVNFGTSPAAKI
jgi:hypothetical protein